MKLLCSLFISALSVLSTVYAGETDYTKGLSVWFDTPATKEHADWESQSLPIGNGNIAANIIGSVETEHITFNEKTLWRGGPNTAKGADYYWNVNKQSAHILDEIRQAFTDGDTQKAERLTRENFNSEVPYEADHENPFRFGNYTTMGSFTVETGLRTNDITNYKRILSLDSALAVVQFKQDKVSYQRNYFISYPANVMIIRFSADRAGKQNLIFSYTPNPDSKGSIAVDGRHGLVYTASLENNGMEYVVRIQAEAKGGTLTNTGGKLKVEGADEVTFYITADTDYKMNFDPDFKDPETYVGVDPAKTTHRWMEDATRKGYEALFKQHYEDYASLFNRVQLKLNPAIRSENLPTRQRLENYRKGHPDYYLEELYYQFGRYLLISSSRPGNMPANLQGIWHDEVDGPWRIDYHNNINIQMNYWPACSTNLDECMLPLVDFIRTLVKPGEKTAKAYFGARGWTASISANIFGFTTPLNSQDMSWNFNPMAGPWLATHIWEYYDYTRDIKFLKETGYELIKSSADFAVDYLWHKPDGTYTAAPSTSPEHGPIDQGATFVHAVVREILLDAIEASKVLKVDKNKRKHWEHVLANLVPYKIGRYGQLMEWSVDIDDPKDEHRHVNHLFGLHPGRTVSPITTPELAEAARVVLTHRGDGATGWSMGWKLNQWARLQDGNHAYTLYGNLLKNGTLDNLWDTHPPFQIDGNFGGTAGVTEMLLQSHIGFIQLLPALPDAWAEGSVEGLCAKGGFEVNMKWAGNKLTEATVHSKVGGNCIVKYASQTVSFKTKKGQTYQLKYDTTTGLEAYSVEERVYDMAAFGLKADSKKNASPIVRKVIDKIESEYQAGDKVILRFSAGKYNFYEAGADIREYYISNHDQDNPKKVGIALEGLSDFTLEGEGAEFIFHGRMIPIALTNTKNCLLKNFSIDFENPHIAQVEIIENNPEKGMVFKPAPWVKYRIRKDSVFETYGEGWAFQPDYGIAFEAKTRHLVYNTSDIYCPTKGVVPTENGCLYAPQWKDNRLPVGTRVAMRTWHRPTPGIFLSHDVNTTLKNIKIHYAEGMGVLAQLCENITLDELSVCLKGEQDPRYFTTQADATHFSGCKGRIISMNGLYEGMMDDAINVHGTYLKVIKRIDDRTLVGRYMHDQAWGFDWGYPGDSVQFIRSETMELQGDTNYITSIRPNDKEKVQGAREFYITFQNPIDDLISEKAGFGIENLSWTPEVIFANNIIRNNRARGSLFSTPRKTIIEDNLFDHTSGTAILLCGDCNGWYETGACRNVLIRRNRFVNALTNMFQFTNAVISIYPEIPNLKDQQKYFHGGAEGGVIIEENEFDTFDAPILYAKSIDGLIFRNNVIKKNTSYKPFHWNKNRFLLERATNVKIMEK